VHRAHRQVGAHVDVLDATERVLHVEVKRLLVEDRPPRRACVRWPSAPP